MQAGEYSCKDRLGLQEPKPFSRDKCQALHLGQTNSVAAGTAWGTALQARTSQGLAKPEPEHSSAARGARAGPTAAQAAEPGCHSTAPCDHRHTAPGRDLPVQDIRSWSEVRKRPLQHLPCESWGCWAPSACRTDSFGMRAEIAACCYLQGCYQENRPRLFTEVQGRRKKELKKTNVKSC